MSANAHAHHIAKCSGFHQHTIHVCLYGASAVPYSFSSFELFLEAARRRKTHSLHSLHTGCSRERERLAPATLYSVSHDLSAPLVREETNESTFLQMGIDKISIAYTECRQYRLETISSTHKTQQDTQTRETLVSQVSGTQHVCIEEETVSEIPSKRSGVAYMTRRSNYRSRGSHIT